MKEHRYKGYIIKRNGTRELPWNIYIEDDENVYGDRVGSGYTFIGCKEQIDDGCYEEERNTYFTYRDKIKKWRNKFKINESISREDVWSGAINVLDGEIEEVHTYEEASNADFHHSFYFSDLAVEKINDGEWAFFFVDDGDVEIDPIGRSDKDFNERFLRRKVLSYLNMKEDFSLNEGGLSRIWQHTKDDNTFAIIGSQDKDTKEDRRDELIDEVGKLSHRRDNKIGYKPLWGRYEYEDGIIGEEMSLIIFNINKRDALRIAKKLNQESIIWKDMGFFGFLTSDGEEDGEFSYNPRNMNFTADDIKLFGSKLARHKNKNQQKWFKFVMEEYEPVGRRNSVRNMATRKPRQREELFSIDKL